MSRRHSAKKREVTPDIKYGDVFVAKLINYIMKGGKKSTARNIVYKAFDKIQAETNRLPVEVFHEALENVRPIMEVKSRRVGGSTFPVPMEVRLVRSESIGIRWIVKSVEKRIMRNAEDSLSKVILDSSKGVGDAMEERRKVHAMADANKAFIHYRW